ncbi:MAG: glycosyltransferase family 4 protein [Pseudomonadota bacterium]
MLEHPASPHATGSTNTMGATNTTGAINHAALSGRTVLFVITEDWFFHSHFMPMAKAAIEAGYRVGVAARFDQHRNAIEALGADTFELSLNRGRFNPLGALTLIFKLRSLYNRLEPDLVHHISLKPVVLGGIAARLATIPVTVNAVTGLGYVFTSQNPRLKTIRAVLTQVLKFAMGGRSSFALLENQDDRQVIMALGITQADRITIVDGAGVDGQAFPAMPLPSQSPALDQQQPAEQGQPSKRSGPLKIALVARMLWSKGIDVAVDAVAKARAQGAEVSLSLVGAPDPLNPQAVTEEKLRHYDQQDGVTWLGRRDDIQAVWQHHDIAMLPSRGGEGLPRSLIEAAACGRPIITTDVPGCREIVIDGTSGLIIPAHDSDALATAIINLAQKSPDDLAAMAQASRAHFETRFTETAVTDRVIALYGQAFTWALENDRLKRHP